MAKKRSFRISTLGSQITSVISVALVLLIIGVLASIGMATRNLTDSVKGHISLICRLDIQAGTDQINALKQTFSQAPYVSSYLYTSPDEVLAQEMEYNPEIMDLLDENPYSPEFELRLKPAYASSDSIGRITNSLEALPYVEEVISQAKAADTINSAITRIMWVLAAVAAALLLISVVLINNTVSLAVYSRRFVIHSMKLVGATPGFIRRPFITAGLISGIVAAMIASAAVTAIQAYVRTTDLAAYLAAPWHYVAAIAAVLLLLGTLICCFSALFATNRYLRASFDYIHKK